MKTIFITEKPSVAQEYVKVLKLANAKREDGYTEGHSTVLNKDVQITWAVGHLIALGSVAQQNSLWDTKTWKEGQKYLPMIPEEYKFFPQKATYKQFQIVKSLYTQSDVEAIYYAGDSGREGIFIQALIRNQIFKRDPKFTEKVVWIDSQTEEEILRGIREAKPYSAYLNMIASGYARSETDWLIGMNFSRAFSLTSNAPISVGRVMSAVLAMIVQRQKEIDEFKKTDFYGINAKKDSPFVDAKWKAGKGSKWEDMLYNENGFLKRENAEKLMSEFVADPTLTVEKAERKEKKEYAPYLFNLAELQGFCAKAFHISPQQTLDIAQELYEDKLITYPRTDSRFLTNAVAKEIEGRIGKKVPSRYIDDSKVTDHYALIPTGKSASGLSGLKEGVYNAIKTRFDAIFEAPYVYDTVSTVYIHANGERFYETATDVKQLGFKALYGEKKKDVAITEHKQGEVIKGVDFSINPMETKPPVPYTTGTMILAMEKAGKLIEDEELREQIKTCGIGTSATRAGIIEKLASEKLQYITIDKKSQKIAPTERGKSIVSVIVKFDPQLISPEKTADMEQRLHSIADGSLTMDDYTQYINGYITDTTLRILNENKEKIAGGYSSSGGSNASAVSGKCPKCGADVAKGKYGYYCTGKCGMFLGKVFGKDLSDKQVASLLAGKSTTSTTKNGKKIKVLPEITENVVDGKTYYNWKTEFVNDKK